MSKNHLLKEVRQICSKLDQDSRIVVIDDGSTDQSAILVKQYAKQYANVELLSLKYNVGHQGAIYQGLLYAQQAAFDKIIIMDGDGQDDPNAIAELLEESTTPIVHVRRGKRKEGFIFMLLYHCYLSIFGFITGKTINFGNYCMIDKQVIDILSNTGFMHFAARLSKLNLPSKSIAVDRRARQGGRSKMNIDRLVQHAFRAFIEYADELLMLFLKMSVFLALFFLLSIAYVIYQKVFTDNAILGWASTLSVGFLACFLICIGFFVIGIMLKNMVERNSNLKRKIFD